MSRTNYIFVDFENVRVTDLDKIEGKAAHVTLVLGEQHKSLPVSLVQKMLQYPGQIEIVETGRAGKNALDLVLASYMGGRRATNPEGDFHVVSKDRDYHAVVAHFRAKGVSAQQHESLASVFGPTLPKSVEHFIARYREGKLSRPKTRQKLLAQIQAQCGSGVSEKEAKTIIDQLMATKVIEIHADQSVRFIIPAASASAGA